MLSRRNVTDQFIERILPKFAEACFTLAEQTGICKEITHSFDTLISPLPFLGETSYVTYKLSAKINNQFVASEMRFIHQIGKIQYIKSSWEVISASTESPLRFYKPDDLQDRRKCFLLANATVTHLVSDYFDVLISRMSGFATYSTINVFEQHSNPFQPLAICDLFVFPPAAITHLNYYKIRTAIFKGGFLRFDISRERKDGGKDFIQTDNFDEACRVFNGFILEDTL